MNAKQEAEKWLASDSIDACECGLHLNNILELLEATERKLAEAEKVVEAANNLMTARSENKEFEGAINVTTLMIELREALSDYEAGKD